MAEMLLVPPVEVDKVVHVFHGTEFDDDYITACLTQFGGTGTRLTIDLTDGDFGLEVGAVHCFHDGHENQRARDVLVALTTVHVVLHGPVIFTGLDERTIDQLVEATR